MVILYQSINQLIDIIKLAYIIKIGGDTKLFVKSYFAYCYFFLKFMSKYFQKNKKITYMEKY